MFYSFLDALLWGAFGFFSYFFGLDLGTSGVILILLLSVHIFLLGAIKQVKRHKFENFFLEAPEKKYPEFFEDARSLAEKLGVSLPKIAIVGEKRKYNSAACLTIGDPKYTTVYICESFFSRFDREELKGIFSHELGHMVHPLLFLHDIVFPGLRKFAMPMLVRWLSGILFPACIYHDNGLKFLILFTAILASILFLAEITSQRQREFIADAFAASLVGKESFARLLKKLGKIEDLYTTPLFEGLLEDHPLLSKRIQKMHK